MGEDSALPEAHDECGNHDVQREGNASPACETAIRETRADSRPIERRTIPRRSSPILLVLGMSVCTAALHGGRAVARNLEGGGAEVVIVIPADRGDEAR
ncbi:MAG: hypothetical protein Kow0062_26590 [Acidobacteriota bacterium]